MSLDCLRMMINSATSALSSHHIPAISDYARVLFQECLNKEILMHIKSHVVLIHKPVDLPQHHIYRSQSLKKPRNKLAC